MLRVLARRIGVVATVLVSGAVLSASSCLEEKPTEPATTPLDCQKGYYEVNGQCVLRPDVVTVEISNPLNNQCPRFSPNPVALTIGQNVRWHNTTGTQVIVITSSTPLVTAPANGYSPIISFSTAGKRVYAGSTCNLASQTEWDIFVTAG